MGEVADVGHQPRAAQGGGTSQSSGEQEQGTRLRYAKPRVLRERGRDQNQRYGFQIGSQDSPCLRPPPTPVRASGWPAFKPPVLSELVIGHFLDVCIDWLPEHPSPRLAQPLTGAAKQGWLGVGAARRGRGGGREQPDVPWQGAAGGGGAWGLAPPAGTGPEPRPGGHLAGERRDR